MKKEIQREVFSNLNDIQKVNYIKNLLFNRDLSDAFGELLKDEKKDLNIIKFINQVLNDELVIKRIKEQYNLDSIEPKTYVYSKIVSILTFYNKQVILNNFFKSLNKDEIQKLAYFEYQNKTETSISNPIFKKYCMKYEKEAKEKIMLDEEKTEILSFEVDRYNKAFNNKERKSYKKKIITFIVVLIVFSVGFYLYDSSKLLNEYKGLVYPGIYLNDTDLSKTEINKIDDAIKLEKEKIENGKLIITNVNGSYEYTYKDLGISFNETKVSEDIKSYNSNLSYLKKLRMVKTKKRYKTFYLDAVFGEDELKEFVNSLNEKLNTKPINDGLVIDNDHNVSYTKGQKGFILDNEKTINEIKTKLKTISNKTEVNAYGDVIQNEVNNEALSKIDTKVSSFTTYFLNQGNRGHNIVLASSKLNNTIVMPNEVFSYYKVVGPYDSTYGYRPAPVYVDGILSTGNGGGVCQLATTLYNAQLRAGLEIVYRTNHRYAPTYVEKGLDATVYSNTTDFKFKNQYKYPIYIVSYVKGNYVTVDIWTSKDALEGKEFEPYAVYSNGGYLAYLKVIKNGNVIDNIYLNKSYYKSH